MDRISNSFYINAIEDGTTLHGNILSTKPLTQAWANGAAVPDWTVAAKQPTVYITLLNGATYVAPDANSGTWKYNGTVLTFDSTTHKSTGTYADLFQELTNFTANGIVVPAVKIIGNLASSNNVDIDTLEYDATYTIQNNAIGFHLGTNIKITSVSGVGIFGIISFDGLSVLTEDNTSVGMTGQLFNADGVEITSGFTTAWKVNDVSKTEDASPAHHITLTRSDVTDNAIVECTFSYTVDGTTLTYTAYESVDDQADQEYLYIQYDGSTSNAAALHKNQSITFKFWVGKQTDSAVDTNYTVFKALLKDREGTVVSSTIEDVPAADGNGWRTLPVGSDGKASLTLNYNTIYTTFGKYMSGYIMAT